MSNLKIIFFGSSLFSVHTLNELLKFGIKPIFVVTAEDKPQGRGLVMTENPVAIWAKENNVEVIKQAKLNDELFVKKLESFNADISIVASYGKIIPTKVLDIPKFKTINVHPSLLPKYRGPAPIEYTLLNDDFAGMTIIKLDKEVDHGPILAQEELHLSNWPVKYSDLEIELAKLGAKLLNEVLPKITNGSIKEIEQDHSKATFTKKIQKKDGELNLNESPEKNLRKIKCFESWPTAYYFIEKNGKQMRVIVTDAEITTGKLVFKKVKPEGKKEMLYTDFLRGNQLV